ncbi:MAG: hypothetical protein AAFU85_33595 [Planctomycetota bacterium]
MYWTILIAANIPVYLAIGWLLFDTSENAAETIFETAVSILWSMVPPIIRVFFDEGADDRESGFFEIAAFFIASIAITYGEHYLLTKYVFG